MMSRGLCPYLDQHRLLPLATTTASYYWFPNSQSICPQTHADFRSISLSTLAHFTHLRTNVKAQTRSLEI